MGGQFNLKKISLLPSLTLKKKACGLEEVCPNKIAQIRRSQLQSLIKGNELASESRRGGEWKPESEWWVSDNWA